MVMTIELSRGHGMVMAVGICSAFVMTWAGFGVGKARKKYNIKYPQMYAEQSDPNCNAFNCYQRAHQNLLENYPSFLMLLGISSIIRPNIAAAAGAVRLLGFISYVKGYTTGDPEKRLKGAYGYLGLLTMLGLSIEVAGRLIVSH